MPSAASSFSLSTFSVQPCFFLSTLSTILPLQFLPNSLDSFAHILPVALSLSSLCAVPCTKFSSDTRSHYSHVLFFPACLYQVCFSTYILCKLLFMPCDMPASACPSDPDGGILQASSVQLLHLGPEGIPSVSPNSSPCLLFFHHICTALHFICWISLQLFSAPLSRLNFSVLRM